jgi:hypothetical protein
MAAHDESRGLRDESRGLSEAMKSVAEIESILRAARELPVNALPRLLGDLEEIRCTAMARLSTPAVAAPQHDELLDIEAAAERLSMSTDYLYHHSKSLPFTRRIGKKLLFSALGIERYIGQSR